jgi:hypothetical protein
MRTLSITYKQRPQRQETRRKAAANRPRRRGRTRQSALREMVTGKTLTFLGLRCELKKIVGGLPGRTA